MDSKAQGKDVPIFLKPEDLHSYKSAKFIDVRDADAYAQGHIKDAVNAHEFFTYLLPTSKKEDVDQMKKYFQERLGQLGITEKDHVIVYEQRLDNQYGASGRGFFILKYMKHPKVSTLEGGLDAFLQLEGNAQQITKEPTKIVPCQYNGQDDDENTYRMADRDEILEIIKNKKPGVHLLDVRDADEWNGRSSSPYGVDFTPRKGRLPNSIWIEWYDFHVMDNERNMRKRKSNEQVEALMNVKGIKKDDEIIIYCFKGSRASIALMALKEAGYNNLKNYFSSWNEWSRDFNLPIDDEIYTDNKQ